MKRNNCILFILLLACNLLPIFMFAQDNNPASECPEPDDKDVLELYQKSQDKRKYDYPKRIEFLEKAYQISPDYAPVCYELGMHWQRRADEKGIPCTKCEEYFQSVIRTCPHFHSNPYFYLGYFYYKEAKYDSAIKYTKLFLNFKDDNPKKYDKLRYERLLTDAKNIMKFSKFDKAMYGSPVPFEPKVLQGVSTVQDEYLPFISPDNEIAFFTRRMKINTSGDHPWKSTLEKEIFCYSERGPDGKFPVGEPMPTPPFNTHYNEGGASITIDNKHLYYTVVEEGGNYDIYSCDRVNGEWQTAKNLGNVINSPDSWDSQPSISADGKTLYFASNRPGGYGGVDIWKSEKDVTGVWTKPINLGPKINTPGDEKSPFLHWDSKTLYFSSGDNQYAETTHMGVGGFDIFYSKLDSAGNWMTPKNMGFPINNEGNEVGFFVSSDGKYGYFASNDSKRTKGQGVGGYDIFYFELPLSVRPDAVVIIKGKVTADDGNSVVTDVELKDAVTKKVTKAVVDSATGEYAVAANIQQKHDQLLVVKKDGYAFSSQLISMRDSSVVAITDKSENTTEIKKEVNPAKNISTGHTVNSKPENSNPVAISPVLKVNMITDPVKVGKAYTLNNIYFDPNKAEIKNESKIVLEEFADYLKANPSIVIEIQGHTDNIGNDNDNQNLSAERAYTVFSYLRSMGVNKKQIAGHRGYGESKPIAGNDTEEGRAKNRRTEFVIVAG